MAVALAHPVLDREPTFVPPGRVERLDVFDVPTSVREHAWTMLNSAPGVGEHWWTMGVFVRDGVWVMVVARWLSQMFNPALGVQSQGFCLLPRRA